MMTRDQEAILAFMGAAETKGKAWLADEHTRDDRVQALLLDSMAEVTGGKLLVTVQGWRFLDNRPSR